VKLVHKSPLLDLVGWYTLVPKTGPTALHLPIHQQISAVNESAVLLGFHIEDILSPAAGDPLPITIYESNMEAEDSAKEPAEGEDREMKDAEAPARMVLRFRKLPYTTETGEAEMIAMQFIREGGANAMVDTTERHILEQFDKKIAVDDGKGKRRAVAYDEAKQQQQQATSRKEAPDQSTAVTNPDANLDRVEAEYMAALQAKFNAVKMMKSRLALLIAYLQRLPLGGAPADQAQQQQKQPSFPPSTTTAATTTPSNTILRHIQALVTNLDLVAPAEQATLEREMQREANDVHLLSMLSDLLSSVSQVREAGKKFSVLDMSRHNRQGRGGGGLAPLTAPPFDPGFGVPPGEIGVGGGDAEPGF
jgi:COP9 signalosome complex subunit 6